MTHTRSLCLLAVILAVSSLALASPIFEFKFNETGSSAANTGSAGSPSTAAIMKADQYGAATDLHSADGLGVGDGAGNRALDLSALPTHATNLPGYTHAPAVYVDNANCIAINGLAAVTYSGWFNADSPIPSDRYGRNPELMLFGDYSNGIEITMAREDLPAQNEIRVHLDSSDAYYNITPYMAFGDTNKWFFWAFTYDGTLTANNAKLYIGTDSGSVALVGTSSLNVGVVNSTTSPLFIGMSNSGIAFDGKTDNFRIDGAALSQTDLEARRGADVPEPVSLILLSIGGLACLRRR